MPPRPSHFRPDIEGLRAVAIVAVLLAHAGVGVAAGGFAGVDVFFVISGYLITQVLVRELEATGAISLTRFFAGRVKRLMPQVLVAIAAVVAASSLLLSPVRADAVASDVMAAGVYAMNWRLSESAVDYFAAGDADRPLDHFWSLAVEEQFYLAWPLMLLARGGDTPPRGRSARPAGGAPVRHRGGVVRLGRPPVGRRPRAGVLLARGAGVGAGGRRAAGRRAAAAAARPRGPPRVPRAGRAPAAILAATLLFDAGTRCRAPRRCCPCSAPPRCWRPGRARRGRCPRARWPHAPRASSGGSPTRGTCGTGRCWCSPPPARAPRAPPRASPSHWPRSCPR